MIVGEEDRKPTFFVHIGLGKAGSSTIQHDFEKRDVQTILNCFAEINFI